jgi:hypothetical protein
MRRAHVLDFAHRDWDRIAPGIPIHLHVLNHTTPFCPNPYFLNWHGSGRLGMPFNIQNMAWTTALGDLSL